MEDCGVCIPLSCANFSIGLLIDYRTQVRLTTRLWVGIPLEPKKALSDGGIVLSTFTTNGYTPEDIPI